MYNALQIALWVSETKKKNCGGFLRQFGGKVLLLDGGYLS